MFEPPAAGEEVQGDAQDVIGLVIGEVPLEQMELAIDLVDQVDLLSKQEDGADPTGTEATDAVSVFVVDISRGHHRYRPFGPRRIVESFLNSPSTFLEESLLACLAFFSDSSAHSKAPLFWNSEDVFSPTLFQKLTGFSSFF